MKTILLFTIKSATVAALALLSSSISLSAALIEPVPVSGEIEWVYNYEEGKALARKTGKPMFVVFRCER